MAYYDLFVDYELIEAICNRQCILFAGSGLSAGVIDVETGRNLPTWKQFLELMLQWATDHHLPHCTLDWVQQVSDLIQRDKLLIAAQELKDRFPDSHLRMFLDLLFHPDFLDPNYLSLTANHRLLPQIGFRALLTTNYDTLIEEGYRANGSPLQVIHRDTLYDNPLPLRPHDPSFLFHLHGQYDRDDLILGLRDYQEVMFNAPGYRQLIETLFSVYTVLFVGFGGNDPNLESILDRLASLYGRQLNLHYLLIEKGQLSPIEIARWQTDRRIRILEYGNPDKDHLLVNELFRFLTTMDCVQLPKSVFRTQRGLKIFISHSRVSEVNIRALIITLEEQGYEAVDFMLLRERLDLGEIPSTADEDIRLKLVIQKAMSEADYMMVLLDEDSARRPAILHEVFYAMLWSRERALAYLPISLNDYQIPAYLSSPYTATSLQGEWQQLSPILQQIETDLQRPSNDQGQRRTTQ